MYFNLFDLIILALLIGSVLLGANRGFVISTVNIISFFCTIFLTIILTPLAKEIVSEHVASELAVNIISGVTGYLFSALISNWLTSRVKEMLGSRFYGFIDRFCGGCLGAVKGFIISLSLYALIAVTASSSYIGIKNLWQIFAQIEDKSYPQWLKNSAVYDTLSNSYNYLLKNTSNSWIEVALKNVTFPIKAVADEKLMEEVKEIGDESVEGNESTTNDDVFLEENYNQAAPSQVNSPASTPDPLEDELKDLLSHPQSDQ